MTKKLNLTCKLEGEGNKPFKIMGSDSEGLVSLEEIGIYRIIGDFTRSYDDLMKILKNIGDFRFKGRDYSITFEFGGEK